MRRMTLQKMSLRTSPHIAERSRGNVIMLNSFDDHVCPGLVTLTD